MLCPKTGCGTYLSPQKSIGFRWMHLATNIFPSTIAIMKLHCSKDREFLGKFQKIKIFKIQHTRCGQPFHIQKKNSIDDHTLKNPRQHQTIPKNALSFLWIQVGQSRAAQTPCAGAGREITDGASFVGACQLRQRWENGPYFLEFTDCANSVLDTIAHFSCFMHIDFQSTKLGMFSFVFQGKIHQKSCCPLL